MPNRDVETMITEVAATVRRLLVARNGLERGCDAAAEAVAWGWEHLDQLATIANPVGYLYRVGQSSLRRGYRLDRLRVELLPDYAMTDAPRLDQGLFEALAGLTPDQRVAVVMVHMYGYSYRDVAEFIGVTDAAVTNYVHRGLARLRTLLTRQGAHE